MFQKRHPWTWGRWHLGSCGTWGCWGTWASGVASHGPPAGPPDAGMPTEDGGAFSSRYANRLDQGPATHGRDLGFSAQSGQSRASPPSHASVRFVAATLGRRDAVIYKYSNNLALFLFFQFFHLQSTVHYN